MKEIFKVEDLEKYFQEAKAGMFQKIGIWTIGQHKSCTVDCGYIKLEDGRMASVKISVTAEEDA